MGRMARDFALIGLALERLTVSERSTMDGLSIAQGEKRGGGAFFIVGISRGEQKIIVRPAPDEMMKASDVVMVVARPGATAALALFKIREAIRAGRNTF